MEKVIIGEILKPQGIKGEVKVKMKEPEFFSDLKSVLIRNSRVNIKHISIRLGYAYLLFEGYEDRNKVELLRGVKIFVEREELPEFKNGEYLIEDLIGLNIEDEEGYEIGYVKDILQYGAADVIIIGGKYGKWQIPFLSSIVKNISIKDKKLIVNRKQFEEVKCEY